MIIDCTLVLLKDFLLAKIVLGFELNTASTNGGPVSSAAVDVDSCSQFSPDLRVTSIVKSVRGSLI